MINPHRVLGVALLVSSRGLRSWSVYVSSLLSTFWFLVVFYILGGVKLVPHVLVGALVSSVFSGCAHSAVYDAYYGLIGLRDAFLASPVTSFEFRVGVALGHLFPSLSTAVVYAATLLLLTGAGPLDVLVLVLLVMLLWALGVSIGYLVPSKDFMSAGPKISLVTRILTLLPPIYYPSYVLPELVRPLAYLAPTYNISEIIKMMLNVEAFNIDRVVLCLILLVAQCTAIFVAVRKKTYTAE